MLSGLLAAVAASAAVWSLLLGFAEWESSRGDTAGVRLARRIAPGNAAYAAQWGLLAQTRPEAIDALKSAVQRDPYYSWAWMQLGLTMESAGQFSTAERYLLKAAEVDRRRDPRWALCNFFFRRGEPDRFWYWIRQALTLEDPDPRPVFRLAWRMAPDPRTILERGLPPGLVAKRRFLLFLAEEHPLSPMEAVLPTLLPAVTVEESPALSALTGKLLNGGRVDEAVEIWNGLCRRRLLPFDSLDVNEGRILTNANFASAPSGQTFDWHLSEVRGVTVEKAGGGELQLRFSGTEPENCRILSQHIPVRPGRHYRLRFESRMVEGSSANGLRWKLFPGLEEQAPLGEWSGAVTREPSVSMIAFAPASEPVVTLVLEYERPRGSTRLSGVMALTHLEIGPAGAP